MEGLAERLCALGAKCSLVKGGHLNGPEAVDVLFDGSKYHVFRAPRIATNNTHGTGDLMNPLIFHEPWIWLISVPHQRHRDDVERVWERWSVLASALSSSGAI